MVFCIHFGNNICGTYQDYNEFKKTNRAPTNGV